MQWQPSPGELVRLFNNAMNSLPEAEKRKMFGYPAAFANGYMFAGLHQDSFVLRLAPSDYATFLELQGSKPFEPMPGHPMKGYVVVPQTVLDSGDEILIWLERASAYAKSLPPKRPKAKSARRPQQA